MRLQFFNNHKRELSMENRNNAPTRFAIYARLASDLAGQSNIEDQVNKCISKIADRNPEWQLAEDAIFTDAGTSGLRTSGRPGLDALLERARQQPKHFDYVVMTDTARLGRNLPDILECIDFLHIRGINLLFVHQRLDSADSNFRLLLNLHCSDFITEQYAKALGQKVRQSSRGRINRGFSTGGRCFGYESVLVFSEDGAAVGAKSTVVPAEAAIVRRIYSDFASGVSAPDIARALNDEGANSQRGSRRQSGGGSRWQTRHVCAILRRDQYRGTVVWGRSHTMKDPETGRARRCRLSEEKVVRVAAPDLAIVDAAVAKAVDERLAEMSGGAACHESSDDTPLFMPDVAKENG
jgi:site-specific DNA recombinase